MLLFTLLLSLLIVIIGVMLKILMIHMRVALTYSRVSLAQFQLVQRAEYWEVILALQAILWYSSWYRQFECSSRGCFLYSPKGFLAPLFSLLRMVICLLLFILCFPLRGFDTVKVSKVKGLATRAMVDHGDVRLEDLVGNNVADAAGDFGRLRQHDDVITARRDLLRVRRYWYPIMLDLHKFMVAISRIEVNHDGYGGTAPDAMVWDRGGIVKPRASSFRLIVDYASLPGPPGFLSCTWCTLYPLHITPEDVAVWPCSVNILLEFSSFLASLHWPQGDSAMGKFGISYFELLLIV